MTGKLSLAVVNSHPIQYFAPLYAYLSRHESIDVTALYCSDFSLRGADDPGFGLPVKWDVDLLSGYRSVFLGNAAKRRVPKGFWSLVVPEMWSQIRGGNYDAVLLHGYAYASYVLAFLAARSRGLPIFLRSETHLGLHRVGWRRRVRDFVLSKVYRYVDGFLAIGTANREYYLALGVPAAKIFLMPYTVDNDRFSNPLLRVENSRTAVRRLLGVAEDLPVVLYASKLMRRKHPEHLVRAAALLRDRGVQFTLLIVGTGEMEKELRGLAQDLRLTQVVFAGFINQSDLPSVFSAADIFALPAESEPWGLVVNEAMCSGLPIVVGDGVGCAMDLVEDGLNGFVHQVGNCESIAAYLEILINDRERCRAMGAASLKRIAGWSYEQCLQGVLEALGTTRKYRCQAR